MLMSDIYTLLRPAWQEIMSSGQKHTCGTCRVCMAVVGECLKYNCRDISRTSFMVSSTYP